MKIVQTAISVLLKVGFGAKAVAAMQSKQVNRIIFTRPAVEAGEHLGF